MHCLRAVFGLDYPAGAIGADKPPRAGLPEVRIDGPVAQVWTYYTFRSGTTFSHCGTDAVSLIRSGGIPASAAMIRTIW